MGQALDRQSSLDLVLELLGTHGASIIALLLEEGLEFAILLLDEVLGDVGEADECEDSAQEAHACREVEGHLALLDNIATTVGDQVREDVVANEAAELAKGGGNAVVLATNGGGAGLRGDEADVVSGADFAEGEENTYVCVSIGR